jgi:hypothetical protein
MNGMNAVKATIIYPLFCGYEICISALRGEQQIGGFQMVGVEE